MSNTQFGIIYKATNIINGKCYIGQTIKLLCQRKYEHIYSTNNTLDTAYFHNAIRKYGSENFIWEVICENVPLFLLNIRETMKIIVEHSHKSEGKGYNLTWGGDGSCGRECSEDTKLKISKSNKGKKRTEDVIRKMCEIRQGENNSMFGRKHSDESIWKISENQKNKRRTDEILIYVNIMLNKGLSQTSIAKVIGVSQPTIFRWIKKFSVVEKNEL